MIFYKKKFIHLKGKGRTEIRQPLPRSAYSSNGWDWTRQKPGSSNFMQEFWILYLTWKLDSGREILCFIALDKMDGQSIPVTLPKARRALFFFFLCYVKILISQYELVPSCDDSARLSLNWLKAINLHSLQTMFVNSLVISCVGESSISVNNSYGLWYLIISWAFW